MQSPGCCVVNKVQRVRDVNERINGAWSKNGCKSRMMNLETIKLALVGGAGEVGVDERAAAVEAPFFELHTPAATISIP